MTNAMTPDVLHLLLAWMIVFWSNVHLATSSGRFQIRLTSLVSSNRTVVDPGHPNFDCYGNDRQQMMRGRKPCEIQLDVCVSHHVLPLRTDPECTLGNTTLKQWLPDEVINIPFSFTWPGALTASVMAKCRCETGNDQQPRGEKTIGHLVFAHVLLPTEKWTRITGDMSSSVGIHKDFSLPSRHPHGYSKTTNWNMQQKMYTKRKQNHNRKKLRSSLTDMLKLVRKVGVGNHQQLNHGGVQNIHQLSLHKEKSGLIQSTNKPLNSLGSSKVVGGSVKIETGKILEAEFDSDKSVGLPDSPFLSDDKVVEIVPTENTSISCRIGSMEVVFRVVCQQNYYQKGCSHFCRPRDDLIGHYNCSETGEKTCLDGWSGNRCTTAVCRQGCPQHRGTCTGPDKCVCKPGWYGQQCEKCRTARGCLHGTCGNNPGQCLCHRGWMGPLCDVESLYCVDHKPCRHNGKCVFDVAHNHTCLCTRGFTGAHCGVPRCHSHFCLHGGNCLTSEGTRYCICPPPFGGPRCQHFDYLSLVNGNHSVIHNHLNNDNHPNVRNTSDELNQSDKHKPPKNHTHVMNNGNHSDWYNQSKKHNHSENEDHSKGYNDEENNIHIVNKPHEVLNHSDGHSSDAENSFDTYNPLGGHNHLHTHNHTVINNQLDTDNRSDGYNHSKEHNHSEVKCTSPECQPQISTDQTNSCDDWIMCQNGGRCIQSDDGFGCTCPDPFQGEFCEIDPDNPCMNHFCLNKGKCKAKHGEPRCSCKSGFKGEFCEFHSPVCRRNFCKNGGSCIIRRRKRQCKCLENYSGRRCENIVEHTTMRINTNHKDIINKRTKDLTSESSKGQSATNFRPSYNFVIVIFILFAYKLIVVFISVFGYR